MIEIRYADDVHKYWLKDGDLLPGFEEVPSVSEVLSEMSNAPALPWWGMRVGIAGVVQAMSELPWAQIANANTPAEIIDVSLIPPERRYYSKADRKKLKHRSLIEAWICDAKRTTNHVSDEAADRGTGIHTVLEALGLGELPDVSSFPVEQRGWVAGLLQWYLDQEPEFLLSEVIVGSARHRYAGRFDVVVRYPDGRVVLVDLKTSKGVYKKHLRQLALYEAGFAEMGLWSLLAVPLGDARSEGFDALEVLHVRPSGEYSLVPSRYRPEHVLPTVAAYHADREGWLLHRGVPGLYEEVR